MLKKEELVSVIIPCYNSEKHMEMTLQFALAQTHKNLEIIIIDDGSTDNSVSIVESYVQKDKRVHIICLKKNNGRPSVPRNIGISRSKGEYIAFLDADDLWHPRKIELQIQYMKARNCSFSSTNMINFKDEKELISAINRVNADIIEIEKIDHDKLLRKNIIPNSSVLVKRKLFEKLRIIEDPAYTAVEDYWTWLMIHQQIDFSIKLHENFLFYRDMNDSISTRKSDQIKKIFHLYSNYWYNGKKLGKIKIWFMLTYFWHSFFKRVWQKKL